MIACLASHPLFQMPYLSYALLAAGAAAAALRAENE